jgi:hypothetical protein
MARQRSVSARATAALSVGAAEAFVRIALVGWWSWRGDGSRASRLAKAFPVVTVMGFAPPWYARCAKPAPRRVRPARGLRVRLPEPPHLLAGAAYGVAASAAVARVAARRTRTRTPLATAVTL